ncbi:MAG: hypothetical protein MUO54_11690 [Anaerolineales bacterium]|nr:hypothetical protein [Anaerolineales bacterium]
MFGLDKLDILFVIWAFFLQMVLIIHFAIRKPFIESYTKKFGWIVYALCIPAAVLSIILLLGGKTLSFWMGGFLFLIYSAYGFWIDYVKKIPWRNPLRRDIMFPYVTLYLSTIMFYWWPVGMLYRPLWYVFAVLFIIGTILNITSH